MAQGVPVIVSGLRCWLFHSLSGHEFHRPRYVRGKMRLVCVHCGWASSGVEVPAERPAARPRVRRVTWWRRRA